MAAFFRAEILGQVIQHRGAIGVRDDSASPSIFPVRRPLLAGQVLFGNAVDVVTLGAGGFHFGLHRSRRKRLAGGAGRLRA